MNLQTLDYVRDLPLSLQTSDELMPSIGDIQLATIDMELCAPADWEDVADQKLRDLASLPKGWNGPNSGPLSLAMISYARSVLSSIMNDDTPLPSFVPAHGGGMQLEWHQDGLDVELMIYRPTEAELSVHFHDGRPPIAELPLSAEFDQLSDVLAELS